MGFSPDGRFLAYDSLDPANGFDLWILPDPLGPPGASKPYPFLQTEFNETQAKFSPDGHWIAYESNEPGRYEVYVTRFPGPGGKKQISTAGGVAPRWRPDGRGLFYVAPDNRLMTAELDTKDGTVEVKKVDALFGPVTNNYDVSSDGQKFLVLVQPEGETGGPLTVVQNWTAGLKK
jgi:eukaryotic-like serine/threonine-protein kinase